MGSVSRIAKGIAELNGGSVLDDYHLFYKNGKWVLNVMDRLVSTFTLMGRSISAYASFVPKVDECINYLKGVKPDDFGAAKCAKELKDMADAVTSKQGEWGRAADEDKPVLYDEYKSLAEEARLYASAFRATCVNLLRNHYVLDEPDVQALLNEMHAVGNVVVSEGK